MLKIKLYAEWVYAILAPALIASLYRVPQDFVTAIIWMAALIYVVIILISFFIKLYKRFVNQTLNKLEFPHILRPILCLFAYIFANEMVFLSVVSANERALNLAVEMKEYVDKHGECKELGDEWKTYAHYPENRSTIKYGEYGTKYFISYSCTPHQKEFFYVVRMNKDSDFRIKHLNTGKLLVKYGHYANVKKAFVSNETNLRKLARMEVKINDPT